MVGKIAEWNYIARQDDERGARDAGSFMWLLWHG
jgi:hypothetical protein